MMFNSLRIQSSSQFYFQSLETDVITTQHQIMKPFPISRVAFLNLTQANQTLQLWLADPQVCTEHSLVLKVEELGCKRPDSITCCIVRWQGS